MTNLLLPQEEAWIERRLAELTVANSEGLEFLIHDLPTREQVSILSSVRSAWRSVLSGKSSPEHFIN